MKGHRFFMSLNFVTDSLLQKLQILDDICNRFFMKQMQVCNGKVVLKPDQQH